jgi:hypothetical protein
VPVDRSRNLSLHEVFADRESYNHATHTQETLMTQTESSTRWVQDRYSDLRGRVLLHIGDHGKAAEFGGYSDGVVLRGERGFAVASEIRSTLNVLIDPELYAADRGRSTESRLRREELCESADRQILAGATCLLAPSRFPSDRSEASLLSVLEAGQEFVESARVPALIPIVIRYDELADRRWIPLVHGEDLPIATIFAGYADPLASPEQLAGAIELVNESGAAMVLRCDLSTAGFIALGATAGAIGSSSSVRHLWLPTRRTRPVARSIFVPAIAGWTKVKFVAQTLADPDLDELFRCQCIVCGPGGDLRNLLLGDGNPEVQDRHSAAASVKLAHAVVDARDPVAAWLSLCRSALQAHETLVKLGISGPAKPRVFESWLQVLGGD